MSEKDPFENFPGGNPFGNFPGGNPFGAGFPGGFPNSNREMEEWFRKMGIDPSEFRKLFDEMQRNLGEAFKNMGDDPTKAFMAGFNVRLGPDGKPQFSTFGNKPPTKKDGEQGKISVHNDEREPLTDVVEDGDLIAITMELPGVEKADIKINMTPRALEIGVDNERRKYHKRVSLPAEVDPKTTKATYKNGVLDVTAKRLVATDSYSVSIE